MKKRSAWALRFLVFASFSASGVNSTWMKLKATLPVLLLLLLAGQMSAELCMAQCEGMRMMSHECGMHHMNNGHCASCKHASVSGTTTILAASETCSGQICNSVLGLPQNRAGQEIKPLVATVFLVHLDLQVPEGESPLQLRTARSTEFIPPFDPLGSSLRI
jgi:hypothetical protein